MKEITAVSYGARSELKTYFQKLSIQKKVTVVHNGISKIFFENSGHFNKGPDFKLLSIGTFDDRKNFKDAITAVHNIPEVKLSLVGDGPNKEDLLAQINSLGLASRVQILGPNDNVWNLMNEYNALLISSTHEGFSLVALEAMASGLPVIAPDLDGLNEIVIHQKTGLLSPKRDGSFGLQQSIVTLMKNPSYTAELSRNGKKEAIKFSIKNTATKYLKLYSSMIS